MSFTPGPSGPAYGSVKFFEATADKTLTNSIAETTLVAGGVGGMSGQPSDLLIGNSIEILCRGVYSCTAIVPSLTIRIKLAGTLIASAVVANLLTAASNRPFVARFTMVCRATGVAGAVVPNGEIEYDVGLNYWMRAALDSAGATVNVDLSAAALPLDITAQWGAANASNILKVNQLRVLRL